MTPHRPRVLLLLERSDCRRVWDEAVPLVRERTSELIAVTMFDRGTLHEQFAALGVTAHALGCRTSRDYVAASVRLARMINERDIEVIHAAEPIPAVVGGAAGIVSRRGLRVFHRQHLDFDDNGRLRTLSRVASRLNNVTLACSLASAASAQKRDHVPAHRVRVAYNGANRPRQVSREEIEACRRTLGVAGDAAVISAVTRLRPEKGIDDLLRAIPQVAARLGRPVHLVIAGLGPSEEDLRRVAAETGVSTSFVGYQDDVALWHSVGDVSAMPSHREGLGVAGIEAMSCGRPLVASAVGGLAELVDDGVSGYLHPSRDSDAIAAALVKALENPARARALGEAGRARFEARFTNEAMVAAWFACYEEYLGA